MRSSPRTASPSCPAITTSYTQRRWLGKSDAWPARAFRSSKRGGGGRSSIAGLSRSCRIDTTRFQSIAWSGGIFTRETRGILNGRVNDPAFRDKAMVLVVHHPPFHPVRGDPWIDGLRGAAIVLDLLARHPRLQLLHGHLHRIFNHILATSNAVGAAVGLRPEPESSNG